MSRPIRLTWRPRSPIRRPIRARRWRPSNRAPISRAGSRVATGRLKPAGTLLVIHRSDRLEEIVGASRPAGLGRHHREAPAAGGTRPGARPPGRARCGATTIAAARPASSGGRLHRRGRGDPASRRAACLLRRAPRQCRPCWIGSKTAFVAGPSCRWFACRASSPRAACWAVAACPSNRWRRCSSAPSTCAAPRPWRWRSTRPAARRCSRR